MGRLPRDRRHRDLDGGCVRSAARQAPPLLVSVDPSIRSTGLALWIDGALTRVERWRTVGGDAVTPAERARLVARWMERDLAEIWDLAIELPQVYAPGRGGGPARDLISVALVVGACAAVCPGEVATYEPRSWIGALPKATSGDPRESPRGARIWSRLSEAEREVAVELLQHDVWDAIGIGLHHLGRTRRVRGRSPSRASREVTP